MTYFLPGRAPWWVIEIALSSFCSRAWLRATCPAGWATVALPGGSRATVGGRIKEPVLSPPSPC